MKPGFTLLEILVAVALMGMISVAVFTGFFQANKGYQRGSFVIDIDERAVLVQYLLDRDLSGAFVPLVWLSQKEVITTTITTVVKGDKKDITTSKEENKEKKEEPIENGFISKKQGDNTIVLSCITSNPIQVYDKPKPRIVRVTYQLVPEKKKRGKPSAYRLLRNQSDVLEFKNPSEKSPLGYEVAGDIKRFSVEYTVQIPQKKSDTHSDQDKKISDVKDKTEEKNTKNKDKKKPTYETFKIWGEEQIKKSKRSFPHFVTVTINLWGTARKRERTFVFKFAIAAEQDEPEKKDPSSPTATSGKHKEKPHPKGPKVAINSHSMKNSRRSPRRSIG